MGVINYSAFTDAAVINIDKLSGPLQDSLLNVYFNSSGGAGYTLGRIPLGSSDFSTRSYSYADTPDNEALENFRVAPLFWATFNLSRKKKCRTFSWLQRTLSK